MSQKLSLIRDVFSQAQKTDATSCRLIEKLTAYYKKVSFNQFVEEFTDVLLIPLSASEKSVYTTRIFKFICDFIISLDPKPSGDGPPEDPSKEHPQDDNRMELGEEEESSQVEDWEENELMVATIQFLLKGMKAGNSVVRLRSCQLVSNLLDSMSNEATIDESIFDTIENALLKRIKDKTTMVRTAAVKALSRLQNPADKQSPILEAYIFHLELDPSPEVRAEVLANIATSSASIGPVLSRTRDVKPAVRKAAYEYITKKVVLRCLNITQRLELLESGLKDRSDEVRNYVKEKLIFAWLEQRGGQVVDLLASLDIQTSSQLCQEVLEVIFQKEEPLALYSQFRAYINATNPGDSVLVPYNKLNSETAFYWQFLCSYLRKQRNSKAEECLEFLLPPLSDFCAYMRNYVLQEKVFSGDLEKKLEHEFVSQQLLIIASNIDLADQVGCNQLKELAQDILLQDGMEASVLGPLLSCFIQLYPDPKRCLKEVGGLVIELLDSQTPSPSEEDFLLESQEAAKAQVRRPPASPAVQHWRIPSSPICSQQFSQELDEFASVQDFKSAHNLVDDARNQKKVEAHIMVKCLTIVAELMERLFFKRITPTHKYLIENLIVPGVRHEDPSIRDQSVRALGLCCLLRRKLAADHLTLLFGISQFDHAWIRERAVVAFFDIFLLYGRKNLLPLEHFYDPFLTHHDDLLKTCNEPTHKNIHTIFIALSDLLKNYKVAELQRALVEGFCKCLYNRRLYSPSLLTQLLLLWFNPDIEDKTNFKQILFKFFYAYSTSPENLQSMEQSFIPTLRELFYCLPSSSLAKVDMYKVIQFYMALGSLRHNDTPVANHNRLAGLMVCESLRNTKAAHVRVLSRALAAVQLIPHNALLRLQPLTDKLIKECPRYQKLLCKFKENLDAACSKIPQSEIAAEEEDLFSLNISVPESPKIPQADTSIGNRTVMGIKKRALLDTTVNRKISIIPTPVKPEQNPSLNE